MCPCVGVANCARTMKVEVLLGIVGLRASVFVEGYVNEPLPECVFRMG